MKRNVLVASLTVLVICIDGLLGAAELGKPNLFSIAVSGVGDTAQTLGQTTYDDLVLKGEGDVGYLIFGANYTATNWSNWKTQVTWLRVLYETKSEGKWLGLSVGGGMDVNSDSYNDALFGDVAFLDVWDPDDSVGKAWLLYKIIQPPGQESLVLDAAPSLTEHFATSRSGPLQS